MSGAPQSLVRAAQFAGSWYPGDPQALRELIQAKLPAVDAAPARAVLAPHAGYAYSLGIAAETYARVTVPERVIVLCPNHRVPPPIISLWPGGAWETPLGSIPVDADLAGAIQAECSGVTAETHAHMQEHAVELHLPILQVLQPKLRIAALVVAAPDYAALRRLGEGLARAVQAVGEEVLLVASSDMTHFESAERARAQDELALQHVLALDPERLLATCRRESISMCGVRPTAAVLVAAKLLGATSAELIRYGHSGETSGDLSRVVAYAGAVIR